MCACRVCDRNKFITRVSLLVCDFFSRSCKTWGSAGGCCETLLPLHKFLRRGEAEFGGKTYGGGVSMNKFIDSFSYILSHDSLLSAHTFNTLFISTLIFLNAYLLVLRLPVP
jgi:hypothetical protein